MYDSFVIILNQVLTQSAAFLPRVVAALLVLIIGGALANAVKKLVVKLFEAIRVSSAVEKTPIEHFLKNAELGAKIEEVLGSVLYWLLMLVVLHTVVTVLGLTSLSGLLERVLAYLPRVISAVIVLFVGVLLAGLVEGLVKGAIRSIDNKAGRLLGKLSSYLVMTIASLAAVSELGIARDFILVLLIGFVTMISLGGGLALGLGGKKVVEQMLEEWYGKMRKDLSRS